MKGIVYFNGCFKSQKPPLGSFGLKATSGPIPSHKIILNFLVLFHNCKHLLVYWQLLNFVCCYGNHGIIPSTYQIQNFDINHNNN